MSTASSAPARQVDLPTVLLRTLVVWSQLRPWPYGRGPSTCLGPNSGRACLHGGGALVLIALSAMESMVSTPCRPRCGLPSVGLVIIVIFVAYVAAALQSAERGEELFQALCFGLLVAGLPSVAIGVIQVFFPD